MKNNYEPKPLFIERISDLLIDKDDIDNFFETAKTIPKKSIRVNTLKISPDDLIKRLEKYDWKINQPYKKYPEIIQIESILNPGEIGKTKEHILGYYYVQEITSMMPILALDPQENELILDLCASPGSKTSQAGARMKNKGTIIANDLTIGRIVILSANLERFGVTNTIITRHDGQELSSKLNRLNFNFDKILVDAPCSGEGNIRLSKRTYLEWSENLLKKFGKNQKRLAESAIKLLKPGGTMIYSTCTHAPEENESVVQHLLDRFDIKIVQIDLPLKTRPGILKWRQEVFNPELKKAVRIYHHDNNLEGFFLCKIIKLSDKIKGEEK
jgi:tRNA (cytosine49-C5)-methyltransferase